ncbi:MAG: GntR family transcriptional regulator, partial [Egibacteraceae bacterium]
MTGVDRGSDRPVYRQVADALRTAIRTGELVTEQRLPSETELIHRYGVSVGGHEKVPVDGHGSPHGRPPEFPTGGREISPLVSEARPACPG